MALVQKHERNLVGLGLALALLTAPAFGADNVALLTLKDHKFVTAEIHVKANTPTIVSLINADGERVEFVSTALKIKRVISGNSTGTMRWRSLAPGRYPFREQFHSASAQGVVVAE